MDHEGSYDREEGSFQTAVVNGKIYVIGGYNDIKYTENPAANFLSSMQEYDPRANKWAEKSPLETGRRDFMTQVIATASTLLAVQWDRTVQVSELPWWRSTQRFNKPWTLSLKMNKRGRSL